MKSKNEEGGFEFDLDDALDVVWENIPDNLKSKFTFEQIKIVLELEQEQLEEAGT